MGHQDVGCSQVSMNVVFCLNEGHAVSHLQGTAHHQTHVCVCSSMRRRSLREVCLIQCCVIFVCVGQMNKKIPTPGSERFLPRSASHTLYLCTSPTCSTQVHSCAWSPSYSCCPASVFRADWLHIPVVLFMIQSNTR